jgi:trk system potassium uptake protein
MATRKTGVVIGMGEFGIHLAKSLSNEGCEVIAIDVIEKRINLIKNFVMKAIVADAAQKQTLEQVISADVNFIVVCIGNIEKSMMATLYLKDFGFNKVYVKAVTDEHERILKLLGVKNIIFPEKNMAFRVATKLLYNNLLDYLPLSEEYSIAEVVPLPNLEGMTLKDSNFRHKYELYIVAVQRPDASKLIFTPGPHYTIGTQDTLMVLGKKDDINKYNNFK